MIRSILSTVVAFLVIGSVLASAQSKAATVRGTVQDEAKNLVPGVQITLTNNETKAVLQTFSVQPGEYVLQASPGVYELKAELRGFQTMTFSGVALGENQIVQMNFVLRVAPRTPPPQ